MPCNCPTNTSLARNVGLQGLRGSTGLAGIVWNIRRVEAPFAAWSAVNPDFASLLDDWGAATPETIVQVEGLPAPFDGGQYPGTIRIERIKVGDGPWVGIAGSSFAEWWWHVPPGADAGFKTWGVIGSLVATAGIAASAYHGWRRTRSIGWTLGWAFFGAVLPIVAVPVALAQGFGKRKGR